VFQCFNLLKTNSQHIYNQAIETSNKGYLQTFLTRSHLKTYFSRWKDFNTAKTFQSYHSQITDLQAQSHSILTLIDQNLPKKQNFRSKVILKLERRFKSQKREIFTLVQSFAYYKKNLLETIVVKYFSQTKVGYALNTGFSTLKKWKNFCLQKQYKSDYEKQGYVNAECERDYFSLSLCNREMVRSLRRKICVRAVYGWKFWGLAPAFLRLGQNCIESRREKVV
jgi:hypothetical protein